MLYTYDPGQTTGWAKFELDDETKNARLLSWGEHTLWRGTDAQILDPKTRFVVYEKIVPRHPSFNPIGLEVIGVIRYLAEQQNIVPVSQMNAQIHGVFVWGVYDDLFDSIKSQHSKDAIAHGITYLMKRKYRITTA